MSKIPTTTAHVPEKVPEETKVSMDTPKGPNLWRTIGTTDDGKRIRENAETGEKFEGTDIEFMMLFRG